MCFWYFCFFFFFFFQAEDGIRDTSVTGVQTCALPICCQSLRVDKVNGKAPESFAGRTEEPTISGCLVALAEIHLEIRQVLRDQRTLREPRCNNREPVFCRIEMAVNVFEVGSDTAEGMLRDCQDVK